MNEEQSEVVKATAAALEKQSEIVEDAVTEHAESIALDMIKVQEKIARGRLMPGKQRPKVAEILAASDKVLDRAQGKPGTRKGETGPGTGGVTIIIEAPDRYSEKSIPVQATKPAVEAIAEGGTKSALKIQEFNHAKATAQEVE